MAGSVIWLAAPFLVNRRQPIKSSAAPAPLREDVAVIKVRPMTHDDVPAVAETWSEAWRTMRGVHGLAVEPPTAESVRRLEARIAHVLGTDPAGSWVAEADDGRITGLAQALVREDLWVLSLLAVAPDCQEKGTGKALLDEALVYGTDVPVGMIFSSRDPRAMRRYVRAGFDLHPSLTAMGCVDRRQLGALPDVRQGSSADLGLVADLDRRLRGGFHGPDIEHLLGQGCRLLVLDDSGYALTRGGSPVFLAAEGEEGASELLRACLLEATDDEVVELLWITNAQQWAIRVALDAALVLSPAGPVMTRGIPGPPACYLPSGAYG